MKLYFPDTFAAVIPVVAEMPPMRIARIHFAEETLVGEDRRKVPVQGKWIYVLHGPPKGREIAAVVHAIDSDEWHIENRQLGESRIVHNAVLELVADLEYECVLSPYRFDAKAEQEVLQVDRAEWKNNRWMAQVRALEGDNFCEVLCDPIERSLIIHQKHYLPALKKWQIFLFGNEEEIARRYVSCTLKVLTSGEDPLDVGNELIDGALKKELDRFEKTELALRLPAEAAMVEVAYHIDSDGYRIISGAAERNGGNDRESAFLHLCAITVGIGHTLPGRHLATRLVSYADRNALQHIVADPRNSSELQFREHRYLANAGMAALASLMPALVDRAAVMALENSLATREGSVAAWTNRLVREGQVVRIEPQTIRNPVASERLISKFKSKGELIALVLREEAGSSFGDAADMIAPPGLVGAKNLLKEFDDALRPLTFLAAAGLELCNTALAIANVRENGPSFSSIQGLVGSSADLTAMVLGVLEKSLLSKATLARITTWLPYAGCLSAICDFVDFAISAENALDEKDYGAWAGYSIAALGAAGMALGFGAAIASNFGYVLMAAATGNIVIVVGAAFVATGTILVRLLSRSEYETFATFCFLGKQHKDPPKLELREGLSWSLGYRLPTNEPADERLALIGLLSNFSAKISDYSALTIWPGKLGAQAKIEVIVKRTYLHTAERGIEPLLCRLMIHLESGAIEIFEFNRMIKPYVDDCFTRDKNGAIEQISLRFEELIEQPGVEYWVQGLDVWIRLLADERCEVPFVAQEKTINGTYWRLPAWLKLHDHGGRFDPRSGSTFDSARIAHLKFESKENSDDRGDLPPALFGSYEQSEIK
jgi:hypothetical protein